MKPITFDAPIRAAVMKVTPDFLAAMIPGRFEFSRFSKVLPNPKIRMPGYDETSDVFYVVLEDESLPEVPAGEPIPELPLFRIEQLEDPADSAVKTLNEALQLDRAAVTALLICRRMCSEALIDHPTILVGVTEHDDQKICVLGFIGLLNGILESAGAKNRVAAVIDDADNQNIIRFESRPISEFQPNPVEPAPQV